MPHCDNCGAYTYLPFSCSYCGGNYCGKCRLPPNHSCVNLDSWKRKPRPYFFTYGSSKKPQKITKNHGKKILHGLKDVILAFFIIVITILLVLLIIMPSFSVFTDTPQIPQRAAIQMATGTTRPEINSLTLERRIHELINQQRNSQGLSSLSFEQTLAGIARKHSEDMAKNNYFSHDNLRGLGPTERGNQVGYSCYKNYGSYYTTGIAENIFQNNLYTSTTYFNGIPVHAWSSIEEIAQSTVNGWMTSPGHRRNILTSTYDREGIGVAISADDKVYITEDFC